MAIQNEDRFSVTNRRPLQESNKISKNLKNYDYGLKYEYQQSNTHCHNIVA